MQICAGHSSVCAVDHFVGLSVGAEFFHSWLVVVEEAQCWDF